MKKIVLFFAISFITAWVYGQGEMNIFGLSSRDLSGTARGVAMGGAFGALGGDITGVSQNPAGIGIYRSAEIVTTLDFAFNFSLGNFAWLGRSTDNNSFNLGIAYNRIKGYGKNYQAKGNELTSSLTDYIAGFTTRENIRPKDFSEDYYERPYDKQPWISVLGYNGGLIEPNGFDANRRYKYVSPLVESETVDRAYSVSERGYIDTYDFIMGGNASEDKIYWGWTLSWTNVRYILDSRHTEEFEYGGGFNLDNYLETKGLGFRMSTGVIFRPVDEFRLGVAYHSPYWYYHIKDQYYAQANCDYITNEGRIKLQAETPTGSIDGYSYTSYTFRTPGRWVMSIAGILGEKALLSLDYEYSNYSKMKLTSDYGYGDYSRNPVPTEVQNSYISEDFKGASTLKVGMEYRVTPQIALRAGYAWMQSPLEKSFKAGNVEVLPIGTTTAYTLDGDTKFFSCGVGYSFISNFYIGVAFLYKKQINQLYTYSPIYTEGLEVTSIPSELKNNTCRVLLTLGYRYKLW